MECRLWVPGMSRERVISGIEAYHFTFLKWYSGKIQGVFI